MKITPKNEHTKCRCRNVCARNGACECGPIVYRATVEHSSQNNEGTSTKTSTKTYLGSTEEFKPRLANHEASFRKEHLKSRTTLSKYIWTKK